MQAAKAKRYRLYLVRDGITTTLDDTAKAADANAGWSSAASFASGLVQRFEESSTQPFLAPMQKVAAESAEIVYDTEGWLPFEKPEYVMGGYILTMRDVNLQT